MMYSAQKLNKQGDNIQPWHTPFPIWNQSVLNVQPGIKIAGRNTNNPRYTDDSTLMAESEEELKSLLKKVKEESEKVGLNTKNLE